MLYLSTIQPKLPKNNYITMTKEIPSSWYFTSFNYFYCVLPILSINTFISSYAFYTTYTLPGISKGNNIDRLFSRKELI